MSKKPIKTNGVKLPSIDGTGGEFKLTQPSTEIKKPIKGITKTKKPSKVTKGTEVSPMAKWRVETIAALPPIEGEGGKFSLTGKKYSSDKIDHADVENWQDRFRGRALKFDDAKKQIFLDELKKHDMMGKACAAAGISRNTYQNHYDSSEIFKQAVFIAKECYRDKLVGHHQDLVFKGTKNPIFNKAGIHVGDHTTMYPKLIEVELKRTDSSYRDKQQLDVNIGGGVLLVPGVPALKDYRQQQEAHKKQSVIDQAAFAKVIEGKVVSKKVASKK